ncbi:N-acetyl-alpha-D-glucosaminyl L-malate synthase BshA [Salinicoccus halitifaciens]|uniref:N-acetyl-alpha-D-glucosaminyl L-malate synthase BshA n=1 Tax=Salinicoccus halitifaciens TaxID=1073415 RepID=A0ABV2E6C6_9STAP|nr:N-acetyl-alpha-D-glucosaminyl L-malate synthase BshA [Salinicoccus halitifaciens]MCD2136976.1 N-acetyl-alpha-D-glucosaminyl L-malate synthase BshA [Salinicoccus halitifaciens]
MRIGITCYPGVGGSGIIATELGIQMAKRGHQVHFITSKVPFRLTINHPNIHIHQTDINSYSVFQYPPYDITIASKIAEVIKYYDLDVIHMHYAVPHAVCGILAKQMAASDVKIISTLHGTDITVLGHDASLTDAIKFGIESSDMTTAVSESLKRDTYRLISPDKEITTVYNFIDETKFNLEGRKEAGALLRKHYGIPEDTKVVMHTSNFRAVKRIEDIIRAFDIASKEVDAVLMLVGDGPEMNRMRQLVRTLDLEDKVVFTGQQSDVVNYYKMSDCFMLLSEQESFGLALLEAMNCGSVPVGTDAGGISEVIRHGETGYIVETGDYRRAAEHLIRLLRDEEEYKKLQKNMLDDILIRFKSENIIDQYEKLYISLKEGK